MKRAAWIAGIVIGLVALVFVVGALLPTHHVAAVRLELRQPPERVFATISDIENSGEWRSGLERIDVLSDPGAPLRWRETSDFGALVMVMDEVTPPRRLVTRIDDPGQPFGGRWTHELVPTDEGTTLTITEEGEVYDPFFRFMSRFVFGHHGTLESYARDLGRHFGETAEPERFETARP